MVTVKKVVASKVKQPVATKPGKSGGFIPPSKVPSKQPLPIGKGGLITLFPSNPVKRNPVPNSPVILKNPPTQGSTGSWAGGGSGANLNFGTPVFDPFGLAAGNFINEDGSPKEQPMNIFEVLLNPQNWYIVLTVVIGVALLLIGFMGVMNNEKTRAMSFLANASGGGISFPKSKKKG